MPQANNERYHSGTSDDKRGQLKLEIDSRKHSPITKLRSEKLH